MTKSGEYPFTNMRIGAPTKSDDLRSRKPWRPGELRERVPFQQILQKNLCCPSQKLALKCCVLTQDNKRHNFQVSKTSLHFRVKKVVELPGLPGNKVAAGASDLAQDVCDGRRPNGVLNGTTFAKCRCDYDLLS
jgi:hypothetical protein